MSDNLIFFSICMKSYHNVANREIPISSNPSAMASDELEVRCLLLLS